MRHPPTTEMVASAEVTSCALSSVGTLDILSSRSALVMVVCDTNAVAEEGNGVMFACCDP
eukprot:scaffold6789_cov217-Chaetoceros_neogracile.AAC.1